MKFHDITMKGRYWAQLVVDASALVHAANDERRVVYDNNSKSIWVADSSQWKGAGKDIPSTTEMWVYDTAAPDGWTINGTPSDQLLAVKGGSTYTTGGQAAGDFTMPDHQHDLNDHTHSVSGTTSQVIGNVHKGDNAISGSDTHSHTFTATMTNPNPGLTDNSGGETGYRPESSVGLICTKD